MYIEKKIVRPTGKIRDGRRRVVAETIVEDDAKELLFETEDVAGIIAEVTGEDVEVSAEGTTADFTILYEDEPETITIESEGDEEILEAATEKPFQSKRRVAASTTRNARNTGRQGRTKTVRRFQSK